MESMVVLVQGNHVFYAVSVSLLHFHHKKCFPRRNRHGKKKTLYLQQIEKKERRFRSGLEDFGLLAFFVQF